MFPKSLDEHREVGGGIENNKHPAKKNRRVLQFSCTALFSIAVRSTGYKNDGKSA
jgi:hypothetical protein